MVRTACKGSAGVSKPPSPGRPVRPLLLLFLVVVLNNKRTYEGGTHQSMLHEEYHKSTVGEDGEIPLAALGSPPQTEIGSFLYSGPSTDMADTVSLPRRPRVHEHPRAWHPDLPITSTLTNIPARCSWS